MSLDYSTEKLTDTDVLSEDNAAELVKAMAFGTMYTGVNPITAENYEEFYKRYLEFHIAGGYSEEYLKLSDVKRFIGFSTNASKLTRPAFNKKIVAYVQDTAEHRMRMRASKD